MKKLSTFLILFLFVQQVSFSQCANGDCSTANMDFEPNAYFVSNADWQASHGTPSVSPNNAWMWSANGIGEGINYHSYNFVAGRQYCITIVATTVVRGGGLADPNAYFKMIATQGDVIGGGGTALPALPSPNQLIANENWNATGPPSTNSYTYTFTATNNFDNLWIYPYSSTMPVVELTLKRLIICDVTPEPCAIKFKIGLSEQGGGDTAITVQSDPIPLGGVVTMNIIKNGSSVYNGLPISYIGTPGNYTICMTLTLKSGVKCTKCFDFCIGKWYEKDKLSTNEVEDIISTKTKIKDYNPFPEELKEKNIEELFKNDDVQLFPNPNTGIFTIQSNNEVLIESITIDNLTNNRLVKLIKPQTTSVNIDLSKEDAGIYIAKIKFRDGTTINKKIIIKK